MRKKLAIVPEGRQVFAGMTVEENLKLGSFNLKKDSKRNRDTMAQVFEYFPRLKQWSKEPAGAVSGGEQQMLAVGRALMAYAELLILDEPSMGLAPIWW
ncbi:MAG: ATP-binding cassette domain-containing protein [Lachnospiraceae bacterium]